MSPETMQVSAPVVEQVAPPGALVTTYRVMEALPALEGADQVTTASSYPAEAITPVGMPGATALWGTELAAPALPSPIGTAHPSAIPSTSEASPVTRALLFSETLMSGLPDLE